MSQGQRKWTKVQRQELRDAFDLFDRDKSGTISSNEIQQILIALNLKPTDGLIRKIMAQMDTDGNGAVDFEEFAKVMGNIYEREFTDDEMRRAFRCFDTDDSGYITMNELRDVLCQLKQNISEEAITDALQQLDMDNDGKISYEEFVQIFHTM